MKRPLAGAVVLAVLASAAPAASTRPTAAQRGHCRAGETVVYSCRFGRATGSVCAAPGRIAYRFGPLGKAPDLAIASTPDWSNVRIGKVIGGGGGHQNHVRFSAGSHDYVVFEGVAGRLTDVPGKRWSGISVWRGATEYPARACRLRTGGTAGTLERVPGFAPPGRRGSIEENDPRFEAWF